MRERFRAQNRGKVENLELRIEVDYGREREDLDFELPHLDIELPLLDIELEISLSPRIAEED